MSFYYNIRKQVFKQVLLVKNFRSVRGFFLVWEIDGAAVCRMGGQDKTEKNETGKNRTGKNKIGQNKTEQDGIRQNKKARSGLLRAFLPAEGDPPQLN